MRKELSTVPQPSLKLAPFWQLYRTSYVTYSRAVKRREFHSSVNISFHLVTALVRLRYATVEECEHIRDEACTSVWKAASTLNQYRALLPRCSELMNRTGGNRSHTTPQAAKPPTCHSLFVQSDCVCLPSCGTFRTRTDSEQALEDTAVFLAIIASFVATAIYVAFLVKRRKAM